MKAIFISYYQAFNEEVVAVLEKNNVRGYTFWDEVKGQGGDKGEPHLGTHAWPTLNSAMLTFVQEEAVEGLLKDLKALDESAPQQGMRAFVLDARQGW